MGTFLRGLFYSMIKQTVVKGSRGLRHWKAGFTIC